MVSITEPYLNHAQLYPTKIAIQTFNEEISYATWSERVNKTASWLSSFTPSNHTLGILLPNGVPLLQLFTGAATAGWTSVLYDLKWTELELQERVSLALPAVFITSRELYSKVKHLHPTVLIWEDCQLEINQSSAIRQTEVNGELPFYMGFTSGTTGKPKAFIRSHHSWVASFECTQTDFQINENDHVLIPGPLIHSHFLYGAISTLFLGGSIYLLDKFSPQRTLSIIESLPTTVVYVVPTMIAGMLGEGTGSDKSLKLISSGAKWEVNSKEQFQQKFPSFSMYEFYGASELSFVSFLTNEENVQKPESVGKPFHNVAIQIRRPSSELADVLEPGKIFVKSEMLFMGYLEENQQLGSNITQECLHNGNRSIQTIHDKDGWVTVDDIGYLDEDGFLFISGREKNMILYGAINIFPEEIEKVIGAHPDVEEVAVIGIDDFHWGQIAAAVVKGSASRMELKRWCRQQLSSVKVPRRWFFIEEMPHTSSGKIARPQVKDFIERQVNSH